MTNALVRVPGGSGWQDAHNRIASWGLGQEPGELFLLKQDSSDMFVTMQDTGIVFDAPFATTGSIEIRNGGELVFWNALNTNPVGLVHSGTDDILRTSAGDGLFVSTKLGVGISPAAHANGDLVVTGFPKFRAGGLFYVGLSHAATADRVWTFQDATDVVVGRATTDTLTNKTLTTPVVNSGTLNGTFAGDPTYTGQASFTNATAPIIVAKLGPAIGQQHTLPAVTSDTIALLAASQTFTNKTLTSPTINAGALSGTFSGNHTYSGQVSFTEATAPIIVAKIGPSSTQQHVIPTATSDAFVLVALAQTLTNKTLTSPTINAGALSGTFSGSHTLSGVVTLSSAGTALDVTNNATVGGTLGVTGTLAASNALTVGGLLSANGGQIAFPAVQNPSAGANTLDDYEEGSWTPSLGGTTTYTVQSGTYIKIGRTVHVWGVLAINTLGTGSTNTISGLPFATDFNDSPGCVTGWFALAVSPVFLSVRVTGSTLVVDGITAAATASGTLNVFGNSAVFRFQATYHAGS